MITESVQQAMKQFRIQAIAAATLAIFVVGCGAGPQPLADNENKKSYENAKVARSIFDANGGDYDKVSAADKKKLIDMYGDEKAITILWSGMKNPPMGGGANSGAPAPAGGGGQGTAPIPIPGQ